MENSNVKQTRETYSPFKTAICDYLRSNAKKDPAFKEKLMNPEKNIDKCLDYILGEVKQSGRNGFCDEEIFSLAMHYYDEPNDTLKQHPHIDGVQIIVNREMPFTEEEKQEARRRAFEELVNAEKRKLEKPKTVVKKQEVKQEEITLF